PNPRRARRMRGAARAQAALRDTKGKTLCYSACVLPDAQCTVAMDSAAPSTEVAPETCRNCGAHATGHFCPNCGQETRVALPTFPTSMREAAGRYVAMDGRLWRTLAALVARPGHLTREYFNGRRKRYIRPARLFLVLYLLLFAVIGFVRPPGDLANDVTFV